MGTLHLHVPEDLLAEPEETAASGKSVDDFATDALRASLSEKPPGADVVHHSRKDQRP